MISVYPASEKAFADNGIKILKPTKCKVYKEDNGKYYCDIKDTIDNLDYYVAGNILRVSTPWGYQCFRISNPNIENRTIDLKAQHVYFDTANYIIKDSYVVDKNCNDALDHLNSATDIISPFTTLSDITTENSYRCVRKGLDEAISDVIDRWGGHLVRDNWNIKILNTIGSDNGVTFSYGKNIEKIEKKEVWDDVVTKIIPVGKDGLLLPETYLTLSEQLYDIPYSRVISFSQDDIDKDNYTTDTDYQNALITDLRAKGNLYLEKNKLPKINYKVSVYIEGIHDIGDTIYVNHPKCNIAITTQVIAVTYDEILDRITDVEFGNFKSSLSDLVSTVSNKVESITDEKINAVNTTLNTELTNATNKINSLMGDSYCIYDGSQFMVVDTLPKESATNVILINKEGIGFSQTGITGTFNSAWNIDGTLDMQKINVINLVADMIKGGTLKLGSNLNASGKLELYDETNKLISLLDKTGITVYAKDGTYVRLNGEVGFAGYDSNDNKIYWADKDEFHMKKSVVEEEITIASMIRMIPITTDTNRGIGIVPVAGGGN